MEFVPVISISCILLFRVPITEFRYYCFGNLMTDKIYNLNKTYSFDSKIASRGYHVYRNSTWQNAKSGLKVKKEIETNKSSKSIDPYTCAIKIKHKVFDTWLTVEHIPRKISHHFYFFSKYLRFLLVVQRFRFVLLN